MHNEPTAFVLRAVPGLLQQTFCVVQTLVARYATRKRLTSPLFANAWRTAANIVCFHGHYTVDLCYVMRDDYANATHRTSITATISRRHSVSRCTGCPSHSWLYTRSLCWLSTVFVAPVGSPDVPFCLVGMAGHNLSIARLVDLRLHACVAGVILTPLGLP